jgi:hypothetical protein
MEKYIVRYNVHLSLGAGGARVGQFKTLDEAKACAAKEGNCQIIKSYYERVGSTNRLWEVAYMAL